MLSNVKFEVRVNEVLGLIGPNGAGKTTLLECLAGLTPETAGSIKYSGLQVHSASRKEKLFFLPDGILPWKEQTVGWTLKFFQHLYERSSDTLLSIVEPLRVEQLQKSRIDTLSKGERKRSFLALSLLTTHPLLLLDEPFDGLDLRQTRDVMQLLRRESQAGRSLLLSIHQLVDAERVCDRLVLLNNGVRVAEGNFQELRGQANLDQGGLEEIFLALT